MSRSQVTRPAVAGGRRRRPVAPDAGSEAGDAASGVALGLDRQRIEDDLMVVRRGLAGRGEKVKLGAVSLLAAVTGTGRGRAAPAGRRWPIDPAAVEIIRLALADALPAVRQRAVDLTIELEAAGGEADALRLLLGSRFSDVRRRALGRILERARQPWAQALVLDMLDDPDAALRHEALASAAGRADGRAVQHHAWALTGPHPSLKLLAIKELGSRPGKAVRELLARALLDPDPRVRRASAQALALADAYEILRGALRAPYADVRAQAALALARIGDRAAAAPLLALVTARGVPADVGPGQWRETMVVALEALAQLGDPAAHAAVCKLLDHPERSVRLGAARTIGWLCDPRDGQQRAPLRAALSHPDEAIRREAALGLAILGDESAVVAVGAWQRAPRPVAMRGCWAAVALGDVAPELLLGFAAHAQASVRALALRLAMLLDLGKLGQRPERCLGLLSCEESGTRIQAVRALRHYASAPVFEDFVRELLHGGWPYRAGTALTRDETRALAALLSHAAPPLRARAARLLAVRDEPDAARFAHDSRLLLARFAPEAGEARRETDRRAAQERQRALVQLAAAVAHDSRCLPLPLPDPGEPDTLTSPAGGACAVLALHDCAAPLLRLACADPVAEVRREARRGLAALGVDPGRLGSDAGSGRRRLQGLLATSHRAATRLACRPRRGEPPAVPGAACAPPSVATTDVPAEPAPRAEAAEPPLWDPAVELLSEPPPQALTSEPPAPAAGSEPPLWDPAVELLSEPPPPATSEPQVSAASSAPSLRAGAAVLDATALALSAELEPAEQRPPWAPAAQGSHRERSTTLPSERMPYLPSTELSTPRFGCPDAGGRTVRLAGAISTPFAVSEIFTFLAQAGWRGELLLVSGGETRRLFFCLGNIVGAYSTAPDERIGMVMYKLGALSDEQHQLLEQADRAGVRFGWAAVESGFIEDGQLYSLLAEQIRRIVFAAIVLPQGTFFFLDGFDEERIATRHSFNANQLLLEGLTRHDEMVLLRERIPSGRHVPLRVEPAGAPPPELAELYAVIDGRRSVEQIARRLRRGEYECTRDIHALLESGHVAITPGGDGAGEIEEPAR